MKLKLLLLLLIFFVTQIAVAQKIISYRFEKEKTGVSFVHDRDMQSSSVVYSKNIITIFIFDSTTRTVKFNNKTWKITAMDGSFNFQLLNNGTHCELNLLDNEILIVYDNGDNFRYYAKADKWIDPKF